MTNDKMIKKIRQVAYHRNGIGGEGFHAVLFEAAHTSCAQCDGYDTVGWVDGAGNEVPCLDCGGTRVRTLVLLMYAAVFDGPGRVAVVSVVKLSDPAVGVAFGANSWRGDRYEAELRQAIRDEESDGSIRIGPFAIPTRRKTKQKTKRKTKQKTKQKTRDAA